MEDFEFVRFGFNVKLSEVNDIFVGWVQALWFPPSDLQQTLTLGPIETVYIPFWMYDVSVTTSCTAKVDRHDADPHHGTRTGNDRIQSVEGTYHHTYPKLMICAPSPSSQGYDKVVVDLVDQMASLEIYPILRGAPPSGRIRVWNSLVYNHVWSEIGEKIVQRKERERCEAHLINQPFVASIKELSLDINFHSVHHRLVHIPFYVTEYTYGGITYKWVCSATSAEAQGTRPYGLGKLGQLGKVGYDFLSSLYKRE